MFLKRLMILRDGEILRDIPFKMGLNLIVDETKPGQSHDSGNNVGKTTVLRLVNYCFGSDGKNIYADPEFKDKSDPAVEEFLTENDVIIRMELTSDLRSAERPDVVIERNFLKRGEKIQRLNGENYSNDAEFQLALKEVIFDSSVPKPTVKMIVAKNIREGGIRTENAVKVLNPHATASDYELLYLFWFGIEVGDADRIKKLEQRKKAGEDHLKRLDKEANEAEIEQALIVLDRTIAELETRKDNLNIDPEYEAYVAQLDQVRQAMNACTSSIGVLSMRKSLIDESVREMEQAKCSVDARQVKQLYEEARRLVPEIQRTFEETLLFHNRMIESKLEFITQDLPSIERELAESESELHTLQVEERVIADKLSVSDTFDALSDIITQLNESFEARGKYQQVRDIRASAYAELDSLQMQLDDIRQGILDKGELFDKRVAEFNEIFSKLARRVYGEPLILVPRYNKDGKTSLTISSVGDNPGTGKKLGQIALFDLSYIRFADEEGIPCLHFIMQDRMENVHDNQLVDLRTVIDESNCQYIWTVLSDKLPADVLASSYTAITLSQDDKLFRL